MMNEIYLWPLVGVTQNNSMELLMLLYINMIITNARGQWVNGRVQISCELQQMAINQKVKVWCRYFSCTIPEYERLLWTPIPPFEGTTCFSFYQAVFHTSFPRDHQKCAERFVCVWLCLHVARFLMMTSTMAMVIMILLVTVMEMIIMILMMYNDHHGGDNEPDRHM